MAELRDFRNGVHKGLSLCWNLKESLTLANAKEKNLQVGHTTLKEVI